MMEALLRVGVDDADGGGSVPLKELFTLALLLRKVGDSWRFTCPSSSSSSESNTKISSSLGPSFLIGLGVSLRIAGDGIGGFNAFQAGEANLLSDVCHSPSASTITSSTSSEVALRIASK
jgi:hypothetical protein